MRDIAKLAVGAAAAASMLISPLALAQSTRAASALPVAKAKAAAPVAGARSSSRLTKRSDLAETVLIPIIVGGVIVGYAFYEVVIDDDSDG